VKDQL